MEARPVLSPLDRAAWQALLDRVRPTPHAGDPAGWVRDRLGEHLWSKQADIAASVVANRRTAVKSCNDSGKSFIASRLATWWIDVHPPGEAFVVSTAPTHRQVHVILWEEIRRAVKRAASRGRPLPGRILQNDLWKLDDATIVGWGRKPADTDEHGFQGIHRRYVLVILDEACGIPAQLWTAVEAITTTADCRILAIGNPDDPATEFAEVCRPGSGWNTITISAYDTPNLSGEDIPDEIRPVLLSQEWVSDKEARWRGMPRFTSRVLGEFPDIGVDTLITPAMIRAAQERQLEPGLPQILGVDVARFGSDRTVIALRQGPMVRIVGEYGKLATTETTGHVIAAKRDTLVGEIRVDGVGVGGGVVDQLIEAGHDVVDMQAGAAANDSEHFLNARAEWYWALRQRFEAGDMDLDPVDDELAAELGALKYKYTARGQVQIESKDEIRKRGLPSPDRADAVMLTAAGSPPPADLFIDEEADEYAISQY